MIGPGPAPLFSSTTLHQHELDARTRQKVSQDQTGGPAPTIGT